MYNYLATWRKARRYAVSATMIAECTRRRLAGDWPGALRAARIESMIDLTRLRVRSGQSALKRIEAELLSLAPDLLRWNLPRAHPEAGALTGGVTCILSSQEGRLDDGPVLVAHTPPQGFSPQWLRLETARPDSLRPKRPGSVIDLPDYLWRADRIGLVRNAYGASEERLPGFRPDGTPLPLEEFAPSPREDDPASRAEAIHLLHEQKRYAEALGLAGIDLDQAGMLRSWDLVHGVTPLIGLAAEIHRLARRYGDREFRWGTFMLRAVRGGRVRGRRWQANEDPGQVGVMWGLPPPDPELVWRGLIHAGELHPAVRDVLFPGARADFRGTEEKIMVRCQGVWHRVEVTSAGLRVPHDAAELERERLLAGLGGPVRGCAAVVTAWRAGTGWLPRALRARRASFFAQVRHGNTAAVLSLLDDGFDPLVRDGMGRSLMHHLPMVDFERLLPRLVAAGLKVDDRDQQGRTPLHEAVNHRDLPLARALLAAGANPARRDYRGAAAAKAVDGGFFAIQLKKLVAESVGGPW